MTVFVAVGSVCGAPGTTALALDLARCCADSRVLLLELDPDGGCLAARLDLPLRPGLTELAAAARSAIDPGELWRYAQATGDERINVVAAHPAAEQVYSSLRASTLHIAAAASHLAATGAARVIVDVGRLRPGSPALTFASRAAYTLVLVDNAVEPLVALHHRARLLSTLGHPMVVLTGARPYPPEAVAHATDVEVWGVVPGGRRRRERVRRRRAIHQLALACGLDNADHSAQAAPLHAPVAPADLPSEPAGAVR